MTDPSHKRHEQKKSRENLPSAVKSPSLGWRSKVFRIALIYNRIVNPVSGADSSLDQGFEEWKLGNVKTSDIFHRHKAADMHGR